MNEITQKLQELAKTRSNKKLIYKQANQKKADFFVADLVIK
jgi:hypothetical protein